MAETLSAKYSPISDLSEHVIIAPNIKPNLNGIIVHKKSDTTKKNKCGRPTCYSDDALKKTQEYIDNYEEHGHAIPSVAGLALILGVGRRTIYDWAKREENEEFSHTLEILNASQECTLLNKGLLGEFNSAITKLALGNHGYSDKQQIEEDEEAPPISITFEVKEAVSDVIVTNAKP